MTLLDHIIPEANFEKIRDQIFAVLYDEFQNQVYNFSNNSCREITWWAERTRPLDKAESGAIIISTFKGDYENKSQGSTHGTYQYVIDFLANQPNKEGNDGDKLSSIEMQKMIRNVRYILEHPNYRTLGFTDAFIEHTEVSGFQIYKDERPGDAMNNAIGQILFRVRCEEPGTPNRGRLIASSLTDVRIEETANGFQYLKVA